MSIFDQAKNILKNLQGQATSVGNFIGTTAHDTGNVIGTAANNAIVGLGQSPVGQGMVNFQKGAANVQTQVAQPMITGFTKFFNDYSPVFHNQINQAYKGEVGLGWAGGKNPSLTQNISQAVGNTIPFLPAAEAVGGLTGGVVSKFGLAPTSWLGRGALGVANAGLTGGVLGAIMPATNAQQRLSNIQSQALGFAPYGLGAALPGGRLVQGLGGFGIGAAQSAGSDVLGGRKIDTANAITNGLFMGILSSLGTNGKPTPNQVDKYFRDNSGQFATPQQAKQSKIDFMRWANTPVTTMEIDPKTGQRITKPMWQYQLEQKQPGLSIKDVNKLSVKDYQKVKPVAEAGLSDIAKNTRVPISDLMKKNADQVMSIKDLAQRNMTTPEDVKAFYKTLDTLPEEPIIVENGRIIDGLHRFNKAVQEGKKDILVNDISRVAQPLSDVGKPFNASTYGGNIPSKIFQTEDAAKAYADKTNNIAFFNQPGHESVYGKDIGYVQKVGKEGKLASTADVAQQPSVKAGLYDTGKLYHGTDNPNTVLQSVKPGKGYHPGAGPVEFLGPSFTNSKEVAGSYGKHIIEHNFTPTNPKKFQSLQAVKNDIIKTFGPPQKGQNVGDYYRDIADSYRVKLQTEGYDAVVFSEGAKNNVGAKGANTVIPIADDFRVATPPPSAGLYDTGKAKWKNDDFWGKAIKSDAKDTTISLDQIGEGKAIGIRQTNVTEKGVQEIMNKIKNGERPTLLVGNRPMGKGEITVLDGNHTLEAYKRLGIKDIPITDNTGGKLRVAQQPIGDVTGKVTGITTQAEQKLSPLERTHQQVQEYQATVPHTNEAGGLVGGGQKPPSVPLNPSSPDIIAQDVKKVLTGQSGAKEMGFVTSVKESSKTPQGVKDLISGTYVPKSSAQLKSDAMALIKSDPMTAEKLALNPQNDTHVQIGNYLINHYASQGNFAKAAQIGEGMATSGTDFGRAVQAFSQYDKTTPEGAIRYAQSKVNEFNRLNPSKKLSINDAQVKSLFDQAHKIQQMPEGKARNIAANDLMETVNNLIPSTIVDKAVTVWKAGLLTSLRTHERNIIGNTLHGVAETAKDIPASLADRAMALRTGQRSTSFTTRGMVSGGQKGLTAMKDIIQKGYDPEQAIAKYDVRHVTWGNNPLEQGLKKYTDLVFRTLGGADKPFWNASYARSLYDQAITTAGNAGRSGDKAFIEGLVKTPTEDMLKNAVKDANIATFHDQSGLAKIAQSFKQVASKNELSKLGSEVLAPFTGVPSSIAGQVVAYSPIGLIKGIAKAGTVIAKNVPELQRQAAQEIGRGVIGTGLLGLGAYLSSKGLLTGQPKDTKEAAQWQLENKPANSIFIGGKWRGIGSIGPENLIVLAGAKAQEELAKGQDASLGTYGANVGKDFLGQTFLQGVQGPLNAITDPARYGQSYMGNQSASLIPNIIKDTSKAFDPYQRENNTFKDYLTNSIPGLRNQNVVKRDVLGNPMSQDPTGLSAYVDLFNSKTPVNNIVVNELSRLNNVGNNATPSKLNKSQTIDKVKVVLSPQQLDLFEAKTGRTAQDVLAQMFQNPQYQALSDEAKSKAIDNIMAKIRSAVKQTVDISGNGNTIKASPQIQPIITNLKSAPSPEQRSAMFKYYMSIGVINSGNIKQIQQLLRQ